MSISTNPSHLATKPAPWYKHPRWLVGTAATLIVGGLGIAAQVGAWPFAPASSVQGLHMSSPAGEATVPKGEDLSVRAKAQTGAPKGLVLWFVDDHSDNWFPLTRGDWSEDAGVWTGRIRAEQMTTDFTLCPVLVSLTASDRLEESQRNPVDLRDGIPPTAGATQGACAHVTITE